MALSSHPICHHEEDKRDRGGRRGGRRHGTLHDEEAIFVWPVLAADAWVLLRANVECEDGLPCLMCMQQRVQTLILSSGKCLLCGLHHIAPVFQMQHLDHGAAHLSCFHVLYKDPFLALVLW